MAGDVYFGTWGGAAADGIYRARFDRSSGQLRQVERAAAILSPGFLAWHPTLEILYAVGTLDGVEGVAAFLRQGDGRLRLLHHLALHEKGACHLAVHPSGSFLMTAQYGEGTTAVFSLRSDGGLGEKVASLPHRPRDPQQPLNRSGPHPHWTGFSPDGRFALVPDLGLDEVFVYAVLDEPPFLRFHGRSSLRTGSGPRHLRFSVDGRFVFVLNELALTCTTFAYQAQQGILSRRSTVAALSESDKAKEDFVTASEIVVHPNGRWVYSANRGHDSVTVYAVDPASGELEVIEVEPIRGAWPRNVNLDPSGKWLLAAGAHSRTLSVFRVDPETGQLQFPRRGSYAAPPIGCILFAKEPSSEGGEEE